MRAVPSAHARTLEADGAVVAIVLPHPLPRHSALQVAAAAVAVNPADRDATNLQHAHAISESRWGCGTIVLE